MSSSYLGQFIQALGLEDLQIDNYPTDEDYLDDGAYPLIDQSIPQSLVPILESSQAHDINTFEIPHYWLNDPIGAANRLCAEWLRLSTLNDKNSAPKISISLSNNPEFISKTAQFLSTLDECLELYNFKNPATSLVVKVDQSRSCIKAYTDDPDSPHTNTPTYFTAEEHHIYVLGHEHGHIGLSSYLHDVHQNNSGTCPLTNQEQESHMANFIRDAVRHTYLQSCRSISIGGIACALAQMALEKEIGASVGGLSSPSFWFGEDQGRYIVTIQTKDMAKFETLAQNQNIGLLEIGNTEEKSLSFNNQTISIDDIKSKL